MATGTVRKLREAPSVSEFLLQNCRCKVFQHRLDGHVFEERWQPKGQRQRTVWTARLQCSRCGTKRIDRMLPGTCILLTRDYIHAEEYDTTMTNGDAKKILFKWMVDQNVEDDTE